MERGLFRLTAAAALLVLVEGCGEQAVPPSAVQQARPPGGREQPAPESPAGGMTPAPARFSEQRLEASDAASFDHFGFAIATSGEVVVAGARFADRAGVDSGAAYVFRRGARGMREEARLTQDDAVEHDRFGHSLALDGETLVVGAHAHHQLGRKAGAAYVFRRRSGRWRQEARLAIPGVARFGHAVAVSGDHTAVGAPGDIVDGQPAGAVYVFQRQGSQWRRIARLTAADAVAHHLFGIAVGLSGDTAVVGASSDDERGSLTGAAYVFRRDGARFRQEAKLLAEDASALAELGKAVAIAGDTVVIGADGAGDVGKFAGAAYVFRRGADGWRQEARLLAEDRKPADRFGNAVAIHGDTIAVGAHFADPSGLGSGAVYVFYRAHKKWRQEAKLTPDAAAAGEEFGNAVAVHGGTVAVGALRGSGKGTAAGSVSVFDLQRGEAR